MRLLLMRSLLLPDSIRCTAHAREAAFKPKTAGPLRLLAWRRWRRRRALRRPETRRRPSRSARRPGGWRERRPEFASRAPGDLAVELLLLCRRENRADRGAQRIGLGTQLREHGAQDGLAARPVG